jgi:hypothetical protein
MGFAQELKDFSEGFKGGLESYKSLEEIRSKRRATDKDIAGYDDPFGGGEGSVPTVGGGTGDANDPTGWRNAIAGIESGGRYDAIGPKTKKGDQAYGKYQMMGANIPAWTKAALGKSMTPQEFLADPKAQDATFDHIFGGYVKDHGLRGAASMWFTGRPDEPNVSDVNGKLTGKTYADRFMAGLPQGTDNTATASTSGAIPEPEAAAKPTYASSTEGLNPKMKRVYDRAAKDNPGLFVLNPFTNAGVRTEAQQKDMLDKGYTTTMKSKHRAGKAVDVVPINPKTGKPDPDYTEGYSNITRAMRKAAQDEGISDLKWGGDWKSFQDRPHWEVSQLEQQQLDAGGQSPDVEQQAMPTMFAAEGGAIPEPTQRFLDGGGPAPTNDPYSSTRAYTQPIAKSSGSTFVPRRVGQAAPGGTAAAGLSINAAGLTPSQQAFRDAQAKNAADWAAAHKPAPAPAPAPVAASPQPVRMRQQGMNVVMPFGNQGGAFGYAPTPQWFKDPTTGKLSQGAQRFARGGAIPDRHERFEELQRQETRQHPSNVNDRGSGESARDRAARRLSAEENRPSSTAYQDDDGYFQKPKRKTGGGGGKPSPEKTGSTGGTHVKHPPNPKVGKPEIAEDRATRFRAGDLPADEDRATRFRPEDAAIPMPDQLPGLSIELQDQNAAPDPRLAGTPPGLQDQVPQAAGTPTSGYEPPTGNFPPRPPIPIKQQSGTPRQRYDQNIRESVPSLTTPQPVLPEPPEGPAQPRPAPQPEVDAERTAADEADTRKRMELVTTPPAANNLVPVLLDPATGELIHDPNAAPVRTMPGEPDVTGAAIPPPVPQRFGYAEGGAVPDEEELQYRSLSPRARDASMQQPASGTASPQSSSASQSPAPEAGAPEPDNRRPEARRYDARAATPKLLADVGNAVRGGVSFLQRHFGLDSGQTDAIDTPEAGQARENGAQRFASGEGAATRQEIDGIDDRVDPNRQLDEGHRQMVRLAKTVKFYQDQGRDDDAKQAAASLMQYGAQRFGQLGSLAGTAYRHYQQTGDKNDLNNSLRFLEQAYQMIPDGANMRVELNEKTGKLQAHHSDAEGNDQTFDISPEELPTYIRKTMDNSLYWSNILEVANPAAAGRKQAHDYDVADTQEQRKYEAGKTGEQRQYESGEEQRKHERDLKEEKEKEARAAEAETAKNAREKQEEIEKEDRANKTENERKLRDEALKREDEQWKRDHPDQVKPKINMVEAQPALAAATEARKNLAANADDPAAKDAYNEALSRLMDATGGDEQFMTNMGFNVQGNDFVYKTAKAAVDPKDVPPEYKQAPDGKYWKKLPNGKYQEFIPESS